MIRKLIKAARALSSKTQKKYNIARYKREGMKPWSVGYQEYRDMEIANEILNVNAAWRPGKNYGIGLDERIVEYPWILSKLKKDATNLLDAGSTLNYDFILDNHILVDKHLTICTYQPENYFFNLRRINYIYEDLRLLPLRDGWFDEVVCISTLEHIDMDNSLYGYQLPNAGYQSNQSTEYLNVVRELVRVLKRGGTLLITVPFGKYEQHGFFQQFDSQMIDSVVEILFEVGAVDLTFFQYVKSGWILSTREECKEESSFNPHTNKGFKNDGAAHSRAICCLELKSRL